MSTINLIHDGKALLRFNHNGRTYIVCPDSGDFEVDVTWPVFRDGGGRREVCISVDGLSVMDGKTASISTRGYIVTDTKLRLPGWRLDGGSVAKFEFKTVSDSYVASKGAASNAGCVGVVVFAEKRAQHYSVDLASRSNLSADLSSGGGYRGFAKGMQTNCSDVPTRSASIGAGFGDRTEFATSTTSFKRGNEIGREVVFYRTRQWLREADIPVPGDLGDMGEAWPGDVVACAPPSGWRG